MSWEGEKGGRVVSWQVGESGRVVRWQGGRVLKWQGGRFLAVFKGGGHNATPRFHPFVSDIDQQNGGLGWVQDRLAWLQRLEESS